MTMVLIYRDTYAIEIRGGANYASVFDPFLPYLDQGSIERLYLAILP